MFPLPDRLGPDNYTDRYRTFFAANTVHFDFDSSVCEGPSPRSRKSLRWRVPQRQPGTALLVEAIATNAAPKNTIARWANAARWPCVKI